MTDRNQNRQGKYFRRICSFVFDDEKHVQLYLKLGRRPQTTTEEVINKVLDIGCKTAKLKCVKSVRFWASQVNCCAVC